MSIDPNNLGSATSTFDDEFNTGVGANSVPNLWNGSSGTWSTVFSYNADVMPGTTLGSPQESEIYVDNNYYGTWNGPNGTDTTVSSTQSIIPWQINPSTGILTLTATPMSSTFVSQYSSDPAYGGFTPTHFSGMLNTYHSDLQTYGYFEIRAKLNAVSGFWPAFWLVDPNQNISDGHGQNVRPEVDIMEAQGSYVTGSDPRYHGNYSMTVHDASLAQPFAQYGGYTHGDGVYSTDGGGGLDGLFHTYGVDWEPGFITFYMDGHVEYRVPTPENMIGSQMYMIANLAVEYGGANPGAVSNAMQIDYVRAYAGNEGAPAYASGSAYDASVSAPNATRIEATANSQTITGNSHNDLFYIQPTVSSVTISNFNPAKDTLDLAGWMSQSSATDPSGNHLGYIFNYEDAGAAQTQGYITLTQSGSNVDVYVDLDGSNGTQSSPVLVAVLAGLTTSQLTVDTHADVVAAPGGGSSSVSTSATPYTAPSGVTDITLTGSGQIVTGNNAGDIFHSNNAGNSITGGTGNDTFDLGRGGDYATGAGGADTFAFAEVPWAASHITDFGADDKVDLSGMSVGSSGTLQIVNDGSGNAAIQANYNMTGNSGWWTVAVLDGVSPSLAHLDNGIVSEGTSVSVSGNYTAPSYMTDITLTGSSTQTIDASATSGVTITSTNNGNSLLGGSGADTFHIGRGGDWVTGGLGADTFSFAEVPWGPSTITDFSVAQSDVVNLTGLVGTLGSDDSAHLQIANNGSGYAQIEANYDITGNSGWWVVATLNGVSSSSVHYSGGFVTG